MRTIWCTFCAQHIDGKTWKRHMRRVHRLSSAEITTRSRLTIIRIPLGAPNRRKHVHV